MQKQLDAATKNLPTFDVPKPIRKGKRAGAKTVRVHINAGRKDRMAPNFILGALVEATGMAGNEFGKIDIHDQYTTVEVPETETDFVIECHAGRENQRARQFPCGAMKSVITTTVAALTADVAAETADSTASPVTAITSTHAAAAITASGEKADIAQQG